MGTSKTKALVNYLKSDQVPKDSQVITISFRKSFTHELHKNIGPDFVDYQAVEGLIYANKVIVQYESLSWLKICDLDKTILILDEAKLILTQTESLQANNGDNVLGCWIIFDHLIKNSAKVIAMDAGTGFCTYDLLASSCKHVCMICIFVNPVTCVKWYQGTGTLADLLVMTDEYVTIYVALSPQENFPIFPLENSFTLHSFLLFHFLNPL